MKIWIIEKDVFPESDTALISNLQKLNIPYQFYKNGVKYNPYDHILRCSCDTLAKNKNFVSCFCYHLAAVNLFQDEMMLNWDYEIMTFDQLSQNRNAVFDYYGGENNKIFIKPESPFKPFEATYLYNNIYLDNILKSIEKENNVYCPDCIVSSWKEIVAEYRFVFNEYDIIGYSSYMSEGEVDFSLPMTTKLIRYIQDIADYYVNYGLKGNMWQHAIGPQDEIWTIDIALLPDGSHKIVELNSLASIGLYDININGLLKGIIRDKIHRGVSKE